MGLYQRTSSPPIFPPNVLQPGRDGALENSIVSHENTHRITNRMTGGGTGRCLQTTEAGGLGEGWSDAMAEWVPSPSLSYYADYVWRWTEQKNATVLDYVLGQYVRIAVFFFLEGGVVILFLTCLNQTGGIRSYPYSTSSWVLHTTHNHPHPFNPWFIYQLHQSFKIFRR